MTPYHPSPVTAFEMDRVIPESSNGSGSQSLLSLVSDVLVDTIALNDGLPFTLREPTPFHTMYVALFRFHTMSY